jgi:hypothetical protein
MTNFYETLRYRDHHINVKAFESDSFVLRHWLLLFQKILIRTKVETRFFTQRQHQYQLQKKTLFLLMFHCCIKQIGLLTTNCRWFCVGFNKDNSCAIAAAVFIESCRL